MGNAIADKNCILIIDDDFINRELLKNIFSAQYTFEEAADGVEGLAQIERHYDKLCAIILDVQMPHMTGMELLEIISERGITEAIPTFFITAHEDDELIEQAYRMGIMDVVSKPVSAVVVQRRVKTVIDLFSARESLSRTVDGQKEELAQNAKAIDELNRGTIEALATAIEFRDMESGQHVSRIYGMTKYILTHTAFGEGMQEDTIESIARAAIMHDVGKIAISDVILNKPGRLTKEEFDIMKQHTVKGAVLLEQITKTQLHESYRYACDIARHHHERYDGKGYPDGLVGDEISVAAQVVSIVDVYDALVSERVYKKAFAPDKAVAMIVGGECGVFNPKLVACFLEAEPVIRQWYAQESAEHAMTELNEDVSRLNATYTALESMQGSGSNAVMDVMLLMTAVQSTYDMIISVNLTKNTYYMVDYNRFLTHCAGGDGVFDDLIELGASSIPPSHRREFHDTFCRTHLIKCYHERKKTVMLEHPQYADDGVLHWVSTTVLMMEDSRTGDILQITLSRYIDNEIAEKKKTRKILADALNLAEQANSVKVDFLSRMGHDIRSPLNAIIGMTTIIAASLDNREKVNDCLVKIGASSRRLLDVVNDVLDFSKIENGSILINKADFNLRDLITELANDTSIMARDKKQTVHFTVADACATSYVGDEFRIRQVLMNLLDNASKFTPIGGQYSLSISVDRSTPEYDILSFVVEDNGVGIAADAIDSIFEPFVQDISSLSTGSVGLGLPISRNLAHLMNGDLVVTSQPNVGSRFTLELPLEKGNLTAYSETLDTAIHVLVVDDEIAVCEHTAMLLHNMGVTAQMAQSGAQAIELVKANMDTPAAFDVAIVDWQMPQMDGVETVRRIRSVVGERVLVVVMSAYDWSDIEEQARAAGVDLFIAKPISEVNLRTAIACSSRMIRNKTDITFDGQRVLLAEDNAFNAEVAKSILEMKGLQVDLVADGKAAYDTFITAPADTYLAILMDILMPIMDGHEATRAIRASTHPQAKAIPIYAMTANAFRADILEAKLAGMNGHIAKPVDFDEVACILNNIVKHQPMAKFPTKGDGV